MWRRRQKKVNIEKTINGENCRPFLRFFSPWKYIMRTGTLKQCVISSVTPLEFNQHDWECGMQYTAINGTELAVISQ